jgi:hypothetical protein
MSTTIYNGFMFVQPTLEAVLEDLLNLQKELHPVAEKLYGKTLVEMATACLDERYLTGKKPEEHPWGHAMSEISKRQKEVRATRYRDPAIDWDFNISVIPFQRDGRTCILGLPFTDQDKFLKVLQKKPWYTDYAYWDSTDPDEKVPEADWKQRERDWDQALGDAAPSERGFSFQVVSNHRVLPPAAKGMLRMQPSVAKRARWIAETLLWRKWLKQKITLGERDVFQYYFKFQKEMVLKDAPRRKVFDRAVLRWEEKLGPYTLQDYFPNRKEKA